MKASYSVTVLIVITVLASGCTNQSIDETDSKLNFEKNYKYTYLIEENYSVEESRKIANTLETRLSTIDLSTPVEVKINENNSEDLIIYTNGSEQPDRMRELIEPSGDFSASLQLERSDDEKLMLRQDYKINLELDQISIKNKNVEEGESRTIDGVNIELKGISGGEALLELNAFSKGDIQEVGRPERQTGSAVDKAQYNIDILLSKQAAERVKLISQNYEARNGTLYREGKPAKLHLYVDGENFRSLELPSVFKRRLIRNPSISGGEELISVLRSGKLPSPPLQFKSSGYTSDNNQSIS